MNGFPTQHGCISRYKKRATYPQRADSSQTKTLTMKKFTIIPSPFLHGDGRIT